MQFIQTDNAPQAIGPYSQAVIVSNFLYSSGQIALDPKTMKIVATSIEDQTKQVLINLDAIIKKADITRNDVIKTTIYLKDMNDFSVVNEIYSDFFKTHKPARSTVEVSKLPKDALIEIDLIAKTSNA